MTAANATGHVARRSGLLAALVFLVALNLRPSLTSVGPLLPTIGDSERLGAGAQGLLGSLPLVAFAVVSPLVHLLTRRVGVERAVFGALLVLAAAACARSWLGGGGLWVGTLVIGAAIAVGNVLVPTLVKRDYPHNVSLATGVYSACLASAAAVASALATPMEHAWGWHTALGVWAVPALVVALAWTPRLAGAVAESPVSHRHAAPSSPEVSVWRRREAWLVTAMMGLQSTTFYTVVTWLPSIEHSTAGVPMATGGFHLFLFQIIGIVAGLLVPRLMGRGGNEVRAALSATVPMFIGVAGFWRLPDWHLAWVILFGVGSGASLVVALSLISLRGRSPADTTRLSGMAQSVGYALAACGPLVAGGLREATGGWQAPLVALTAVTGVLVLVAVPAGRRPLDRS